MENKYRCIWESCQHQSQHAAAVAKNIYCPKEGFCTELYAEDFPKSIFDFAFQKSSANYIMGQALLPFECVWVFALIWNYLQEIPIRIDLSSRDPLQILKTFF